MSRAPVPILTYHSLDDSGSVISVAPDAFEQHLAILADRGWTGIRLDTLLDAWAGRGALPERPVVITFDDGFRNLLERGVPALARHGFGATVFVVTGWAGKAGDWPGQGDVPRLPLLGWDEVREVSDAGVEVASHTVSHPHLPDVGAEKVASELDASKAVLEEQLGKQVTSFAYPYGDLDDAVVAATRQRYRGAVTVRLGTAKPADDPLLLPRLDVYYLREPKVFATLGTARGAAYLAARGVLRGVKRRLTGRRE